MDNWEDVIKGQDTHQLLPRAFVGWSYFVGDIPFFALLCCVEPSADAESLSSIFISTDDDFLDGMETVARLNLKKDELVPAGWYALYRDRIWLKRAVGGC